MDVVARVDRRFDSSTILRLSTFFHADWLRCRKARVSLYRAGEEKPIERYKTRVKVAEENKLFSSFQKYIIEFLGLNEQTQKFGLGSFELKFYCLTKINGKAENYAISTHQQLVLEFAFLLGSDVESERELNGKKSVI